MLLFSLFACCAFARAVEGERIHCELGGVLPVRFDLLTQRLDRPDLLFRMQHAHGLKIDVDEPIGGCIRQTAPGMYCYRNEKGQRWEITELYRGINGEGCYELLYSASGRRFFVRYDMLLRVRTYDAGRAGTLYIAALQAAPRNTAARLMMRRFGAVERTFRSATRLVAGQMETLCRGESDPISAFIPSSPPAPQRSAARAPQSAAIPLWSPDPADPRTHTSQTCTF